jgi:two-component system nitrogen regulation sensor histidine kinase NtrY
LTSDADNRGEVDLVTLQRGSPLLDPSDRAFWTGFVVMALSVTSALVTYLILTGLTPIVPRDEVVLFALAINFVLLIAMLAIIAYQVIGFWRAWRDKIPGARLHVRIVALFCVIAALPAILLAAAATTTFSVSLDSWFTSKTRAIIANSLDVARAYVNEHGQVIRTDIVNMARDIDASFDTVQNDPPQFTQLLMAQAGLRELPSVYIIDKEGRPLITALEDPDLPFIQPSQATMAHADSGQVPLLLPANSNRVVAVKKLERFPGQYLYVAREVSGTVLAAMARTEQGVSQYEALRQQRGNLTLVHGLMYLMISLSALLAAIWTGIWFAGRFVAPIRRLIIGAQQVSRGNLTVELPEKRGEGDLRRLSHTFNLMTRELKHQRDALVETNEQLTDRRRFMEAVLSGVSAGVIGLDSQDNVTLLSRSAQALLATTEDEVVGKKLADVLPAFGPIVAKRDDSPHKQRAQDEVSLTVGGDERTFAVRITREQAGEGDVGSVVTFDDITELVSAQRTAAWADVARRIAHEIKNPLTPIILSAERIRRKYGKVITEDRETFDKLTATIERQAGDIKTMVDEFASFARVPKPVMEQADLREAVQEPIILFREAHASVDYKTTLPEKQVKGMFDRRLITQAVTNLVKNATEAVETYAETAGEGFKGRVGLTLEVKPEHMEIRVRDNGTGLPKQNRTRLLEPYVTTKGHKGTGLGLAIVQKIIEQHGGTLFLEDAPLEPGEDAARGAQVRIHLPIRMQAGAPGPTTASPARPAA